MNEELKTRLKSLAWRTGGMVAVVLLGFLIDNETALNVNPYVVTFAGLIMGEITKQLNK